MKDLIEDHLSCAVILQKQQEKITPWKRADVIHTIIYGTGLYHKMSKPNITMEIH